MHWQMVFHWLAPALYYHRLKDDTRTETENARDDEKWIISKESCSIYMASVDRRQDNGQK